MVEWLSDEWLKEVADLAGSRPPLSGANGTVSVSVGPGKGRDVAYHWRYRDGMPGEGGVGAAADADVALTIERADAWAVLHGEVAPSVAYMRGRLKASGDGGLLLDLLKSTATEAYEHWRRQVLDLTEAGPEVTRT
jgi:hypothetical protein